MSVFFRARSVFEDRWFLCGEEVLKKAQQGYLLKTLTLSTWSIKRMLRPWQKWFHIIMIQIENELEETKDFRFKNTTFRGTVSYNSKIFKYSNCNCKPECRPGFGILDVRSNKCVYNTPPHKPKTWDVLYHTRLTLWKCLSDVRRIERLNLKVPILMLQKS